MKHFHQGLFKPKNIDKYVGNASNIVYRSGYEYKFMTFLDNHPNVIKWMSEELIIPYVFNGKPHRYFPDFVVEFKGDGGNIKRMIVEIKPYSQTLPPKMPKRKTPKALKNYEEAIITYAKNIEKWKYANEYAKRNNAEFKVLTEKELFKS